MKFRIKWLLTAALVTWLLCCISAMAVEIVDSGTCGAEGDNVRWALDNEGTLSLSGTGEMDNYSDYNDYAPWYSKKSNIKQLIINNGISTIGRYAFCSCDNLVNILIPDSVTRIDSQAFSFCVSLESIVIPDNVIIIDRTAFRNCSSMKSVMVSSENNAFCSVDGVLFDKSIKKLVYYPSGKTDFSYSIPATVIDIGKDAFSYNNYLVNITIPDSVTNIDDKAFDHCKKLTNLTIPSSVTNIGSGAFAFTNITHITIPPSITQIKYSTFSCSNLMTISIPSTVTSIGDFAFSSCKNLNTIDFPSSITTLGYGTFYDCSSLTNVQIPNTVTTIEEYLFSFCTELRSVTIPDSVTRIGGCAFQGCVNLKSLTIPENVSTIDYDAFLSSESIKLFMPRTEEITIEDNALNHTTPTIYCYEYTPVEGWARSKGYQVILLDNLTPNEYISLTLNENDSVGMGIHKHIIANIFPKLPQYKSEWSSSNTDIVVVDANGVVTGISIGTATITLSYGGVQASCQVTVLSPEEYISINLSKTATAGIGMQTHLEASVSPWVDGLEQEWISSDPSIVTVSSDGILTGISAGTADVTLSYGGVQAVCRVTVVQYAENFSIPDLWLVAKTGTDASLLISDIKPSGSVVQFSWHTGNSTYATVDATGYVTAGAVGDTTLTVTDDLSGLSRTSVIHSCYPVTAIDLSLSEPKVIMGKSIHATAYVTMRTQNCENHLVTFSSSNPSIAAIDQNGTIQTFKPGTVTISAIAVDNESINASTKLTVMKNFRYILTLPNQLTEIRSEAFADLPSVETVRIPASVTSIADDAFSGSDVIILAPEGSYAVQWAKDHEMDWIEE